MEYKYGTIENEINQALRDLYFMEKFYKLAYSTDSTVAYSASRRLASYAMRFFPELREAEPSIQYVTNEFHSVPRLIKH